MGIIRGFKSPLYYEQMTYREQEANKLWSNYNPQNEENFWEAYEALLGKKPLVKVSPAKKILPKQPSFSKPSKARIATQVFYPNTKFLMGRAFVMLLPLIVMVVSVMQTPSVSVSGIFAVVIFMLIFYVIYGRYVLAKTWDFMVTNDAFILRQGFILSDRKFLWQEIQKIEVVKEMPYPEAPNTQIVFLKLEIINEPIFKAHYWLSPAEHQRLFETLAKKLDFANANV